MRQLLIISFLVAILGCKASRHAILDCPVEPESSYVIKEHHVANVDTDMQSDYYTVRYGSVLMKVRYASLQTSSAKPGDFPGTGLHGHRAGLDPDLTQIPDLGVPIRRCRLTTRDSEDGDPIIDTQPTPAPCMVQLGDTLQYEPSPNAGDFTSVIFDILSEKVQ